MKKTLFSFLAFTAAAVSVQAETATLSSVYSDNYNATLHGFYFNLESSTLQFAAGSSATELTDEVYLDSFTLKGAGNAGTGVTFGLLIVDSNNAVLGMSDGTYTTANNNNPITFNFKAVDGGSLKLDSSETYRALTVSSALLDLISDPTATYVYSAGNGTASSSVSGGITTLSAGLVAPGIRGHWESNASDDALPADSKYIAGRDGTTVYTATVNVANEDGTTTPVAGSLTPYYSNITVTLIEPEPTPAVPEPATATLSLLALAGLAARRRRR